MSPRGTTTRLISAATAARKRGSSTELIKRSTWCRAISTSGWYAL
jgi:hypothetical protein